MCCKIVPKAAPISIPAFRLSEQFSEQHSGSQALLKQLSEPQAAIEKPEQAFW